MAYKSLSQKYQEAINKASTIVSSIDDVHFHTDRLHEFAAVLLDYSDADTLSVALAREKAINTGVFVERCPIQKNQIAFKARNIVVVFDKEKGQFLGKSLTNGLDFLQVTHENCDVTCALTTTLLPHTRTMEAVLTQGDGYATVDFKHAGETRYLAMVTSTDEGVTVELYEGDKAEPDSIVLDTYVLFNESGYPTDLVDLATPYSERPLPTAEGESFEWLKVCDVDDTNDAPTQKYARACSNLHLDSISDRHFPSHEAAVSALESGVFGWRPEDLPSGALVKVSRQLVLPSIIE